MIANLLTFSRMILSLLLLTFSVFSPGFYACYLTAGITDMIDGSLARRLGTNSEFGAKLDTAADFILVVVCLIKLIPVLEIENWMFIWIGIIATIKLINIISGFAVQKRFMTVHSVMNKITGGLLFALPLTVRFIDLRCTAAIVCAAATFAAVQEGHYIRTGILSK